MSFRRSLFARSSAFLLLLILFSAVFIPQAHAQWTPPTQEELSMTSQPQVPGASAVYLYFEKTQEDPLHMYSIYVRLKVLTEAGKDFANVKISYGDTTSSEGSVGYSISDISGRTIHSDGTIIPFTGKPYTRTVAKTQGYKLSEKVFTLPDVEVGSIIEYRYKLRFDDNVFFSPQWLVQQDLYLRKGYFFWKPTGQVLHDQLRDQDTIGINYSIVLPKDAAIKDTVIPGNATTEPTHKFELTVHDVPPIPKEEYMPPIGSFTDRVNFYYAIDHSEKEFWVNEGKAWAKSKEHFIGSPGNLSAAVQSLVAAGDTDTVKLQKIYTAVMAMENTSFTRQHDASEDKAHGYKQIKTVQDIWERKSGYDDQLTDLFVGLARAAGMKAYVMRITNRDANLFSQSWLSRDQLDDDIAIVVLDGKEQFFDPGQRGCPFGQMAWKHTGATGLRELEKGTAIASTPQPLYTVSQTHRIADLTMDSSGGVHGTIMVTWLGSPALEWRQQNLKEDEGAMKRSMREWLQSLIPASMEPEITVVDNVNDSGKPLTAHFNVKGQLATVTSKRFILPGELFEANSKPLFPSPTRDIAIYFPYPGRTLDAVRVRFPDGMKVESAPQEDGLKLQNLAVYQAKQSIQPTWVQMNRDLDMGTTFFLPKEYSDVRTFYNKMASEDQQPIVLLTAQAAASSSAAPAAAGK